MDKDHFSMFKRDVNGKLIYYYYIYTPDGKRKWKSTGQTNKAKAIDVIKERLAQGTLSQKPCIHKEILFKDFSTPFSVYSKCPIVQDKIQRGGHYSKSFCLSNRQSMKKHISPYFDKMYLSSITPDIVNTWILQLPKKHKVSHATANKMLTILRSMLDVAVRRQLIPDNPARKIKNLVENPVRRNAFTMEQVERLFKEPWKDTMSYTACLLAATTGMRLGEIRALKTEQIHKYYIDVNASWDYLDGRKCTKSGKDRQVPINEFLYNKLKQFDLSEGYIFTINGMEPVGGAAITNPLQRKMQDLGIDSKAEGLTFHSFRHFFNSRLVASGVEGDLIRAAIGHESIEMTDHYLHLQASDFSASTVFKIQFLEQFLKKDQSLSILIGTTCTPSSVV